MEPGLALRSVETALRNIVRDIMGDSWTRTFDAAQIARLKAKQAQDRKKRLGANVTDDLLAYTETRELTDIILNNWKKFQPVFKNEARMRVSFEALNSYRLPAAHSRPMRTFEVDLLSGISGQLRSMIALYQNAHDPGRDFFARIESCTDSFGDSQPTEPIILAQPARRLKLGSTLTFDCVGWDTDNRELSWDIQPTASQIGPEIAFMHNVPRFDRFIGNSVSVELEIEDRHVLQKLFVMVAVRSSANIHRYRFGFRPDDYYGVDDYRTFVYAVDPR